MTTKIHALVDHRMRPVVLRLTAGQAGDNPQLVPLLDDWARQGSSQRSPAPSPAVGRQGLPPYLDPRRAAPPTDYHTIPERSDQREYRAGRGSKGGRPPSFDPACYAQRNTIERGFGRLKQWRGIASRYDKYALVFLGGTLLAAILQYRQ